MDVYGVLLNNIASGKHIEGKRDWSKHRPLWDSMINFGLKFNMSKMRLVEYDSDQFSVVPLLLEVGCCVIITQYFELINSSVTVTPHARWNVAQSSWVYYTFRSRKYSIDYRP